MMRVALIVVLATAACCAAPAPAHRNSVARDDKPDPAATPTTHALLSKLGMQRLLVPAAHHRKRLAEQARRHAAGDSRMYVIKLPPSASYYAHSAAALDSTAARTLPLSLRSNGKPARVYHWNLPTLRRLAAGDARPQARLDDDPDATWPAPAHPNAIDAPAPAYYAPGEPRKPSFRKYYSGNGKPKSFYVIDKSRKPAHYHRLLP